MPTVPAMVACPHEIDRWKSRAYVLARPVHFPGIAMDDDTKEYPVDVILLDSPIHDADELIEAELDDLDIGDDTAETSEVVLLDMVRLDGGDLDFA